MTLSPRIQRLLLIFLMVYYVLFGGAVYTENNPPLRVAHQVFTALLFGLWLLDLWRRGRAFPPRGWTCPFWSTRRRGW
ncbi:MAG: hypothetical protein M5R40_02285 [Anaerolineae bacterium]|nr:hypothetical protein [Anaerolineae bacterium]